MIKEVIKYEDFDGNMVEDTFYFHFSKAELARLEFTGGKGNKTLSEHFYAILEAQDNKQIYETFETILSLAVGVKSEDGKRFIKNDEARSAFFDSNAYSELFMKLIGDPGYSENFFRGLVPAGLAVDNKPNA